MTLAPLVHMDFDYRYHARTDLSSASRIEIVETGLRRTGHQVLVIVH